MEVCDSSHKINLTTPQGCIAAPGTPRRYFKALAGTRADVGVSSSNKPVWLHPSCLQSSLFYLGAVWSAQIPSVMLQMAGSAEIVVHCSCSILILSLGWLVWGLAAVMFPLDFRWILPFTRILTAAGRAGSSSVLHISIISGWLQAGTGAVGIGFSQAPPPKPRAYFPADRQTAAPRHSWYPHRHTEQHCMARLGTCWTGTQLCPRFCGANAKQ